MSAVMEFEQTAMFAMEGEIIFLWTVRIKTI